MTAVDWSLSYPTRSRRHVHGPWTRGRAVVCVCCMQRSGILAFSTERQPYSDDQPIERQEEAASASRRQDTGARPSHTQGSEVVSGTQVEQSGSTRSLPQSRRRFGDSRSSPACSSHPCAAKRRLPDNAAQQVWRTALSEGDLGSAPLQSRAACHSVSAVPPHVP